MQRRQDIAIFVARAFELPAEMGKLEEPQNARVGGELVGAAGQLLTLRWRRIVCRQGGFDLGRKILEPLDYPFTAHRTAKIVEHVPVEGTANRYGRPVLIGDTFEEILEFPEPDGFLDDPGHRKA